jgi:hypothetical protein
VVVTRILISSDRDAAYGCWPAAQQRLADWDEVDEWFVTIVDDMCERLGLLEKIL